jgi:hypothetical protein
MVMVNMPPEGKNTEALTALQFLNSGGLGHGYLQYCYDSLRSDSLPVLPHKLDRSEHGLAVAEWGYQVLSQFCQDVGGYTLVPVFDGSGSRRSTTQSKSRPPILDALELTRGMEDQFHQMITTIDSAGHGYTKPQSLVRWCRSASDIQLPGGSKAVASWLEKVYKAEYIRHPIMGRVLYIPNLESILGDYDADD